MNQMHMVMFIQHTSTSRWRTRRSRQKSSAARCELNHHHHHHHFISFFFCWLVTTHTAAVVMCTSRRGSGRLTLCSRVNYTCFPSDLQLGSAKGMNTALIPRGSAAGQGTGPGSPTQAVGPGVHESWVETLTSLRSSLHTSLLLARQTAPRSNLQHPAASALPQLHPHWHCTHCQPTRPAQLPPVC